MLFVVPHFLFLIIIKHLIVLAVIKKTFSIKLVWFKGYVQQKKQVHVSQLTRLETCL